MTADLSWPGGHRTWAWQGDLPADSCVEIGHIDVAVPIAIDGVLTLELTLEADGHEGTSLAVTNTDAARIEPMSGTDG